LSNFVPWIEENLGLDTKIEPKKATEKLTVDKARLNMEFMGELEQTKIEMNSDDNVRAFHSHG